MQVKKSTKPKRASEQDKQQTDPDPVFYREVDMSDMALQYSEDIETFRQFLFFPDPRDSIPRSSTTVWALNDVADQLDLRPRGPSAMLPLSLQLKYVFDKFEQDFQATNYPRVNIQNIYSFHL